MDLDELMRGVRSLAGRTIRLAGLALRSGADVEHVHDHYVAPVLRRLEDAEARAVLAAAGDVSAFGAIEALAHEMLVLRDQLSLELGGQGDDGEAER